MFMLTERSGFESSGKSCRTDGGWTSQETKHRILTAVPFMCQGLETLVASVDCAQPELCGEALVVAVWEAITLLRHLSCQPWV